MISEFIIIDKRKTRLELGNYKSRIRLFRKDFLWSSPAKNIEVQFDSFSAKASVDLEIECECTRQGINVDRVF